MIQSYIGILRGESPFFIVMAEQKTPRQELLEAIEAYATSKTTDDKCLQRLAMVHLAGVLKRVDIVAPVQNPPAPVVEAAKKAMEAKKAPAKRKPRATKAKKPNEDL